MSQANFLVQLNCEEPEIGIFRQGTEKRIKNENKNKLTNPCTKIRACKDPDCQILLHFSDNLDGMIEREMRVLRTVT